MKRHHLINIHLVLAAFLLPFLLMMPFIGVLHLLGADGGAVREKAFDIVGVVPENPAGREAFFRQAFKDHGVSANFETIKGKGDQLSFRPSSRTHFAAKLTETGAEIFRVTPTLTNSMMELHKGHGPKLFKYFEMLFGLGLILIALSGVVLAWVVKTYRKKLFLSFAAGAILFLLAAFL